MITKKSITIFFLLCMSFGTVLSDDLRSGVHNGNQVRTLIYNYGSIGRPNTEPSLEWPIGSGQGYAYEFGLLVGTIVQGADGARFPIVNEGLLVAGIQHLGPDNGGFNYGWNPIAGYHDSTQSSLAMSDDPASWPTSWQTWPGIFNVGETLADQESFYTMDDRYNTRYAETYIPNPDTPDMYGAGLEVKCRGFQWNDPIAEDFLILTYDVMNTSIYQMDSVVIGMKGDPHIGGAADYSDDWAGFYHRDGLDTQSWEYHPAVRNLYYAWDANLVGDGYFNGREPGYMGIKVLNTSEGHDLSAINLQHWSSMLRTDDWFFHWMTQGQSSGEFVQNADNIVLFGLDPIALAPGESERFAFAFVFGETKQDFLTNVMAADDRYWSFFENEIVQPQIEITTPLANTTVSGEITIDYQIIEGSEAVEEVSIYVNKNDENGWLLIERTGDVSGSYNWDTNLIPDGYNYQIAVSVNTANSQCHTMSDLFSITNSNATGPEVMFTNPIFERLAESIIEIGWRAGDADGDATQIVYEVSPNDGNTWIALDSTEGGSQDVYLWDSREWNNGSFYRQRLTLVQDGNRTSTNPSIRFRIGNEFPNIPDSDILHVAGLSHGRVTVLVVDSSEVTGDQYEISFSSNEPVSETYSVRNLTDDEYVIADEIIPSTDSYSSYFQGVRLYIDNPELIADEDLSGWVDGDCEYEYSIGTSSASVLFPYDYRIEFFNEPVEAPINMPDNLVNCRAWNTTLDQQIPFALLGSLDNSMITDGNSLYLINRVGEEDIQSWRIRLSEPDSGNFSPPNAGDIFELASIKPFSTVDTLRFSTGSVLSLEGDPMTPMKIALYQNYPNPFNPITNIRYEVNEPGEVSLVVFDLRGRYLITLADEYHNSGQYSVQWVGNNEAGTMLSTGVYLCRLQSGTESKTIKMLYLK